MKYGVRSGIGVLFAVLVLSGCGESPPSETAAQSEAMPDMEGSQADGEHIAQGTVNSLDRAAGTINVSHEPVESAGWPAMTMNFRLADPDVADELEPGQRIEFRFTLEGGGTVTAVDTAP